jgi:hypothetical protein
MTTRWRRFCALAVQDPQCRGELNGADYPDWTATLAHVVKPAVMKRLNDAAYLRCRREAGDAMQKRIDDERGPLPEWYVEGEGPVLWQAAQRDPKLMASFRAMTAACTYQGPEDQEIRPTPSYPPRNGRTGHVGDEAPPQDDGGEEH